MAGIRADICFGKRCRRLFGVDTLYFNYCSAPFNFGEGALGDLQAHGGQKIGRIIKGARYSCQDYSIPS